MKGGAFFDLCDKLALYFPAILKKSISAMYLVNPQGFNM